MSAISVLNPKAEVARAAQALAVNMSGAKVSPHLSSSARVRIPASCGNIVHNVKSPGRITGACKKCGIKLLQFSTVPYYSKKQNLYRYFLK